MKVSHILLIIIELIGLPLFAFVAFLKYRKCLKTDTPAYKNSFMAYFFLTILILFSLIEHTAVWL